MPHPDSDAFRVGAMAPLAGRGITKREQEASSLTHGPQLPTGRGVMRPSEQLNPSARPVTLSTLSQPSMHSEYLGRKDSGPRHTRVRSLSNESDSSKFRSSVPLLAASNMSSMSTLSSSFYQYDSTGGGGGAALDLDVMETPTSLDSSGSRSKRQTPKDAMLRLPPVQERALRSDAMRMTRELIAEQLQALDVLHNRNAFVRAHSPSTLGDEVATAKGVRVFEKPGIGGGGLSGRSKKHALKRYTAHWQVRATVDEIAALLTRDDRDVDKYASCQAALHPETVNSKLMWRAAEAPKTQSRSRRSNDDNNTILTIEMDDDEDELQSHSDRGWGGHGKPRHTLGPHNINNTNNRRDRQGRRRRRAPEWVGINWWVQHMPQKLSRDRDFVVLEKQNEFRTRGSRTRARRGFVHLSHSVDLTDVSTIEKRLVSPFVRGLVIQSGLVVVESDEPGVVDVANTLEMDCAGHLSTGQQRQVMIKRLLHVDALSELLWKSRLLKSQLLLQKPRLEKSHESHRKCARCQFKSSLFSRRPMAPCRVCDRVICSNCSSTWEFAPALIAAASPDRQLPMDVNQDGVLKASICSHCVTEYSRPQLQSPAIDYEDDEDDDEDEAYERADVIDYKLPSYPLHQLPKRKLSRPSSAPIPREHEWDPSRSSRIAEGLVDDFLTSMTLSPGASVLPLTDPLSPSAWSEDLTLSRVMEPTEPQAESDAATQQTEVEAAVAKLAADVLSYQHRRESRAQSYTPLQGPDQPRRKTSMFESIPEPAPRKTIMLYEV